MKKILVPVLLLALAVACGPDSTPTSPAVSAPAAPTFDDIANKLDETIDAVAEAMPLTVGGANGTTTLYVNPTGGDGKSGCNLTGSTTLVVTVGSSNTAVATVSPTSITFTSCGDKPVLTVRPVGEGSATITLSLSSNDSQGTFDLGPAKFMVNVAAPPPVNTAPTLSIVGVDGGASYNKGAVPTATCSVKDTEDGNSSFAATLSAITGPYAVDGIGSQTASCSYKDGGGLTAASSVTYSIVDPSAPSISSGVDPASPDGSNGWYKANVTLTWTVTESESPSSLQKTGCLKQTITDDQVETPYTCSATSAGGAADEDSVKIKRDATAPSIDGTASPAANSNGWNKEKVTVSFACSDATSGVATCSDPTELGGEGANQSVAGNAADSAGNSAATSVSGINIDLTKPSVNLAGGPTDGNNYYFGNVPAAPTCSANDGLSGLDGTCSISGYDKTVGTHTVSATAKDKAGNESSASATYTVLAWTIKGFYQPTDMGDVVNTVKGGSTVPLKFEIFAGSTELTDVSAIDFFKVTVISCTASTTTDEIELVTTGGTVLRYDTTAGQFIQNWQTPKAPGLCYKVMLRTDDGSSISALFKLK